MSFIISNQMEPSNKMSNDLTNQIADQFDAFQSICKEIFKKTPDEFIKSQIEHMSQMMDSSIKKNVQLNPNEIDRFDHSDIFIDYMSNLDLNTDKHIESDENLVDFLIEKILEPCVFNVKTRFSASIDDISIQRCRSEYDRFMKMKEKLKNLKESDEKFIIFKNEYIAHDHAYYQRYLTLVTNKAKVFRFVYNYQRTIGGGTPKANYDDFDIFIPKDYIKIIVHLEQMLKNKDSLQKAYVRGIFPTRVQNRDPYSEMFYYKIIPLMQFMKKELSSSCHIPKYVLDLMEEREKIKHDREELESDIAKFKKEKEEFKSTVQQYVDIDNERKLMATETAKLTILRMKIQIEKEKMEDMLSKIGEIDMKSFLES